MPPSTRVAMRTATYPPPMSETTRQTLARLYAEAMAGTGARSSDEHAIATTRGGWYVDAMAVEWASWGWC